MSASKVEHECSIPTIFSLLNSHLWKSCPADISIPSLLDFLVPKLREIGLDPVVAKKESTGLIYGRVWAALKREVMMVLTDEVGTPEDIDKLFRYSFKSKVAPCELMDDIGLQTVCNIEDHYVEYSAHSGSDPSDTVYPLGRNPQGIVVYTPNGYMSAQLQVPGQPDFNINDLDGGSKDELAQAGKNYLAYTGPFYLDQSGDEPVLKHHMMNCSFLNWMGNMQRRMVSITKEDGNKFLKLGSERATMVMGEMRVTTLEWRRLADNQASTPPHTD